MIKQDLVLGLGFLKDAAFYFGEDVLDVKTNFILLKSAEQFLIKFKGGHQVLQLRDAREEKEPGNAPVWHLLLVYHLGGEYLQAHFLQIVAQQVEVVVVKVKVDSPLKKQVKKAHGSVGKFVFLTPVRFQCFRGERAFAIIKLFVAFGDHNLV